MTEIRGIVRTLIMETCVDSLEPACNAKSVSADRIELCADLIIRPRYGDLYYDSERVHTISWVTKEREWRRRT